MAAKILDKYKTQIAEVALVPSSGGAFEINMGDETVYSKLQTGRFPSEGDLLSQLDAKF